MNAPKLFAILTLTAAIMLASPACTAPPPTPAPTVAPPVVASPTATSTPTATTSPTNTPTPQPTATATPVPTPEPTATAPPTLAPTATPTPEPTATPIPTPTNTPRPTPTPRPTSTPTPQLAASREIQQLPWVEDGISDDDETRAIKYLRVTAQESPDQAMQMLELSWVQDTITADEAKAIEHLRRVARDIPAMAERMLQKPWVQDGITRDEGIIIRNLSSLARRTDEATQQKMVDAATSIIDMPFLDDVTLAEARAVLSLYWLSHRRYQDSFRTIMSHPKVQDGITDQEAKVLTVLRTPAYYKPEAIPHLLDGLDGSGGVYLEERIIQLPLTGETLLTIVRTQNRTTASMDYLEHAVRFAENLIAAPLPTNYVALYFGALGPNYGANNWWTHMAMRQSSDGPEEYARTVAHEVGHYYFRDSSVTWINEGTANIMHILAEYKRTGSPLETHLKNRRCDDSIKTLAATELLEDSSCARNLGERFFLDLYRTLGEDAFLQGFRALYRLRLADYPDDCRECTDLNVHHVLDAFTSNVPEDVAAKAKAVLLKWYGPLP